MILNKNLAGFYQSVLEAKLFLFSHSDINPCRTVICKLEIVGTPCIPDISLFLPSFTRANYLKVCPICIFLGGKSSSVSTKFRTVGHNRKNRQVNNYLDIVQSHDLIFFSVVVVIPRPLALGGLPDRELTATTIIGPKRKHSLTIRWPNR